MKIEVTSTEREKTTVPTSITLHFGSKITRLLGFIRRAFNPDERRAYLEAQWNKDDLTNLLSRAKMNIYAYKTGVIRSTPSTPKYAKMVPGPDLRICVTTSMNRDWGDCVSVGWFLEAQKAWQYLELSPARARLLARLLVERAAYMEDFQQCLDIDGEPPAKAT